MNFVLKAVLISCGIMGSFFISMMSFAHGEYNYQLDKSEKWAALGNGSHLIGTGHGEIAVAKNGEIYVSVLGEKGGIQVFNKQGAYLRDIAQAPKSLHDFVIHQENGQEFIYGVDFNTAKFIKMTLSGHVILNVNLFEVIPEKYQRQKLWKTKDGKKISKLRISGIAVASNDEVYIVDGYGLDFIHHFNKKGQYLTTFGGKEDPYNFSNCHKIAIDPRFSPNRIMCTDRRVGRLVHLDLAGNLIGNAAEGLRRPSAVDFYGELVAVAEISGRVALIDKAGKIVKTLGTNDIETEVNTDKTAPKQWREGVFTAPHGIAFDKQGNLIITEYNLWGRLLRFNLNL